MSYTQTMSKLDITLLRSSVGEAVAIFLGGGSVALDVLGWITPVMGFLGALLGLVAGCYTLRLKRGEFLRARDSWNRSKTQ